MSLPPPPFEARFTFLFPAGSHKNKFPYTPRFVLLAPDILELKWSVFDHRERMTVGRGETPEAAVDAAITTAEFRAGAEAEKVAKEKTAAAEAQVGGAE